MRVPTHQHSLYPSAISPVKDMFAVPAILPKIPTKKHILMCPADFLGIEYEINPWVHEGQPVNRELAKQQWRAVYDIYARQMGWTLELSTSAVEVTPPVPAGPLLSTSSS